jgi:hypothetical protein
MELPLTTLVLHLVELIFRNSNAAYLGAFGNYNLDISSSLYVELIIGVIIAIKNADKSG